MDKMGVGRREVGGLPGLARRGENFGRAGWGMYGKGDGKGDE